MSESVSDDLFVIKYDGRLAAAGALSLDDYAASLSGWLALIDVAMQVLLRSNPETSHLKTNQVLQVEVRSEREGSWEAVIAFVAGVSTNAAWDGIKWTAPKLMRWVAKLAQRHKDAKAKSRDVDSLAASLEAAAAEEGIALDPPKAQATQLRILETSDAYDMRDDDRDLLPDVPRLRGLVDTVDKALKAIVTPINRSCDSIELREGFSDSPIIALNAADKAALDLPLILIPTELSWRKETIKFVRINRKTGRALFYFADDPAAENNAHYSVITDKTVHKPANAYTDAFNRDVPLTIFLRHTSGEPGTIRAMWEIHGGPDADLFSEAG